MTVSDKVINDSGLNELLTLAHEEDDWRLAVQLWYDGFTKSSGSLVGWPSLAHDFDVIIQMLLKFQPSQAKEQKNKSNEDRFLEVLHFSSAYILLVINESQRHS